MGCDNVARLDFTAPKCFTFLLSQELRSVLGAPKETQKARATADGRWMMVTRSSQQELFLAGPPKL